MFALFGSQHRRKFFRRHACRSRAKRRGHFVRGECSQVGSGFVHFARERWIDVRQSLTEQESRLALQKRTHSPFRVTHAVSLTVAIQGDRIVFRVHDSNMNQLVGHGCLRLAAGLLRAVEEVAAGQPVPGSHLAKHD